MTSQPDDLELIEPTADHKDDYLAMSSELAAINAMNYAGQYEAAWQDFAAYLRRLQDDARGVDIAPGRVPQSTFWLVKNRQRIVGEIRIRHRLNEFLEHHGGHIGYAIRPSDWHKGYGKRQLALALPKARDLGLTRVMLTCDVDNVASARIIEANGGKLASQGISNVSGKMISRYWIALQDVPGARRGHDVETQSPTAEITEPPATHGYHSPWLAVIGVSGYKRANDAIELLNHVPTLTRRLVLYSPKQELPLDVIYASAPE